MRLDKDSRIVKRVGAFVLFLLLLALVFFIRALFSCQKMDASLKDSVQEVQIIIYVQPHDNMFEKVEEDIRDLSLRVERIETMPVMPERKKQTPSKPKNAEE